MEQRVLLSAIAPDPTFGNGGIVLNPATPVGVGIATAYDPATGGVVEAGSPSIDIEANAPILLQRYSATGVLDISFGVNATASDPAATGQPNQVAVESDGSILVVATHVIDNAQGATYLNILAKYTSSGALDTTFGSGGVVQLNTASFTPFGVEGFLLLGDGEIVVAGTDTAGNAALEEFTAAGQPDTNFGSGGIADGGAAGIFDAVTADSDGNLIAAGSTGGSTPAGLLQRFSAGGIVDSTFNSTGSATAANVVQFNAVTVLGSGEIQTFGQIDGEGGFEEFLNRFTASGSPDTTYGGGTADVMISVTILPAQTEPLFESNGELLLAGGIPTTPGNSEPGLALVNTDGSLDTGFGSGGYAQFGTAYGSEPEAGGISLEPNGEILLGLNTADSDVVPLGLDFDPTLMTAGGEPDTTFGVNGTAPGRPYFESAQVVTALSNGQSLVAGLAVVGGIEGVYVQRYNVNGSVDDTFAAGDGYDGVSGYAFVGPPLPIVPSVTGPAAVQIAVDGSGRILVAEASVGIIRLKANGDLDTTFGTGGTAAITSVGNFILDASGRILVASGGNQLSRLTSNGIADPSFSSVTLPLTFGSDEGSFYFGQPTYGPIALQSNGMILVGGQAKTTISDPDYQSGTATNYDMAVTRVSASGAIDTSFGNGGVATADFTLFDTSRDLGALDASDTTALAVLSNGDIVAGGFTQQEGWNFGPYTAAGAEFLPSGKLNTAFGTGGELVPFFLTSPATELMASVTNVFVLSNGDLAFAGAVADSASVYDAPYEQFYVQAFTSAGDSGSASFGVLTQVSPIPSIPDDGPYDALLDAALTPSGGIIAVGDAAESEGSSGIGLVRYNITFTDTVSGTVFNDLNGDGTQESGETGLAGRTVYADLNNNGQLDAGEPFTLTNSSGNYMLSDLPSGAEIIRQVLPSGWQESYPALGGGNHVTVGATAVTGANFGATTTVYISGTVFNDANKNGVQDSGEAGLAGWTVYIDLNNSKELQSGDPQTTTNSSGQYDFAGLAAGTYIVRVIPAAGWTQTYPTGNLGQHITLAGGGVNTNVPFGFANPTGSISGVAFDDANKNGKQDSGESGESGWTVYIDLNNSDKFVSGDPETATNSSGQYSFTGLAAGTYIVRVIPASGWTQTYPVDNYGQHITLASGTVDTGVSFGFVSAGGSISGVVFDDANKNGKQDSGESGESGWTVYIDLNNSKKFLAGDPETTTNSSGQYSFTNLAAGTYIVRAVPPAGWTQTYPVDNYGQHITLASGGVVGGVQFGFAPPAGSISGEVFDDANGDGKLDDGESGLAGWTVYIDLTNSKTLASDDPTTTTNAEGDFTFGELAAGTYIVRVIAPTGWSQIYPIDNYGQHITISTGQNSTGVLFGEELIS